MKEAWETPGAAQRGAEGWPSRPEAGFYPAVSLPVTLRASQCLPVPTHSLPWPTLTTDQCQTPESLPTHPIPSEGWVGGGLGGRSLLAAGCGRGRGGCFCKGTASPRQVVGSPLAHFSAPQHPCHLPPFHGSRGAGSKEAQQPDHQLLPPPHTNPGHKAPFPQLCPPAVTVSWHQISPTLHLSGVGADRL